MFPYQPCKNDPENQIKADLLCIYILLQIATVSWNSKQRLIMWLI